MEEIKKLLDASYNEIVSPLENYSGDTRNISGMMEYMTLLGDVMIKFAEVMNEHYKNVQINNPDKKEETGNYIKELYNKIISTYKPK